MATKRTQTTEDNPLMLLIAYLAKRMSDKQAIYFLGNGEAQVVTNGNIPSILQFEGDMLRDVAHRCFVTLTEVKNSKVYNFAPGTKKAMEADLKILKLLVDG